jgi:hypothetical protein
MKKLLLLSLICVTLFACQKEHCYTCTCTQVYSDEYAEMLGYKTTVESVDKCTTKRAIKQVETSNTLSTDMFTQTMICKEN